MSPLLTCNTCRTCNGSCRTCKQACRTVQSMHPAQRFLSAGQVSQMLGVDRSTVYRMAESGRLPAMKIGRQWRFPAEQIAALLEAPGDLAANTAPGRRALLLSVQDALPLIELAAELLGVMMVITDMAGEPVTEILNPCPWFSEHSEDPVLLSNVSRRLEAARRRPGLRDPVLHGTAGVRMRAGFHPDRSSAGRHGGRRRTCRE